MDILISCQNKTLRCGDFIVPVRIGKAGFADSAQAKEGDAKTPLGAYNLRFGFYRADRLPPPQSPMVFRALRPDDGWCDAPDDPAYNRFIKTPYAASHESLWRDDGAYDIILVMSHNDSPPVSGKGSAVFFHVSQIDDRQTLGCVALSPDAMARLLPRIYNGQRVIIEA